MTVGAQLYSWKTVSSLMATHAVSVERKLYSSSLQDTSSPSSEQSYPDAFPIKLNCLPNLLTGIPVFKPSYAYSVSTGNTSHEQSKMHSECFLLGL